jgi:hypothetical protein
VWAEVTARLEAAGAAARFSATGKGLMYRGVEIYPL